MTGSRDTSDPVSKARKLSAPVLLKRFYKHAEAIEEESSFSLCLDGKRANTPARNPISVTGRSLAEALAAEWNAQGENIDPAAMPVTRLVNSAIDGVAPRMAEVRADILAYAGTDALCYRADEPEGLVAEQNRHWDPVIDHVQRALGVRFTLAGGVVHVEQPAETLDAVRTFLDRVDDPFRLAGLHVVTTITGSALLALAHCGGVFYSEDLWVAAHVDEDWNIRQWGEDAEAAARRDKRHRDFRAAALAVTGA
ncbi:MAG TPA: ATP12 family protein [Afifellaceae bacterium]|nr:ATP12 family protein [Afifellaceae bacterium]